MLSFRSVKLLALGTAGALFIGYCFYFDRKRTSAPDYKKKVHERREREAMATKLRKSELAIGRDGAGLAGAAAANEDDDQLEMQMRFVSEVQRGESLIKEGRVDQGLTHISNAIMLCAHPGSLLEMLQASLPEPLFRPLMMRLAEMNQRSSSSSSSEASSEMTSDQLSDDTTRASSTCASTTTSGTATSTSLPTSQPGAPAASAAAAAAAQYTEP